MKRSPTPLSATSQGRVDRSSTAPAMSNSHDVPPALSVISVRDPEGGACRGPYLVVRPSGAKSRAYRYRLSGRTRKYAIAAIAEGRSGAPATRPTAIGEGRNPSTEKEARLQVRPLPATIEHLAQLEKYHQTKKPHPGTSRWSQLTEHFAAIINHDDLANGRRLRPPHIPPPRATGRGVDGLSPRAALH